MRRSKRKKETRRNRNLEKRGSKNCKSNFFSWQPDFEKNSLLDKFTFSSSL